MHASISRDRTFASRPGKPCEGVPESGDHVVDAVAVVDLDAHACEAAALDAHARELLLLHAETLGRPAQGLARDRVP